MVTEEVEAAAYRAAALRDVDHIIRGSNFLAHLQNVEVALRRALCIVANARLYELQQGWKTATDHAVLAQIMSEVAFKKAYDDGVPDAAKVNAAMLRIVIPSIDMLGANLKELEDGGVDIADIYQAFCRVDKQGTAGEDSVQRPAGGDTGEEANVSGSGDSGEEVSEAAGA